MAIVTMVVGVLLLLVGASGYECKALVVDPAVKDATIYPFIFGVLFLIFGFVGRLKSEKIRSVSLYANSALGVIGLLLSALLALNGYGSARSEGVDVDSVLLYYRLSMTVILLVYLNLCIRAILNVRAARKAAEE